MISVSVENIPPMQCAIIIDKQNITRFHGQRCYVFLAYPFDLCTILQRQRTHGISIKDLCHSNLWNTTWPSVAQLACMIVRIVEPNWNTCYWVAIYWTFCSFYSLETTRFSITLINHLQVHVKFGSHSRSNQIFYTFFYWTGKRWWNIQVANRYTNLSIIQRLQYFWVHIC